MTTKTTNKVVTMDSVSNEIEALEQELKDTESIQQRQYIEQKLKDLYDSLKSNGA